MNHRTLHRQAGATSTLIAASVLGIGACMSSQAQAQTPAYSIVDLGVLASGNSSQATGISNNGTYVSGRNLGSSSYSAVTWTNGAIQAQTNLAGRSFANAYSVNNSGTAVGVSSTTSFGSSPLPVIFKSGAAAQLPLPSGQTAGRAYSVNAAGTAVGSVGSGVSEVATIWTGGSTGTANYISATLADGSYMTTAYGINAGGLVAGNGINPNNAAVNVGLVYNSVTGTMTSVGATPGNNGALAFGLSPSGLVVGSSMVNQGSGTPYIWSATMGIRAIPLAEGATQGIARAVNDLGQVVGNDGGQYSVPFFYQNGTTYRLQDLISTTSGWDLSMNTSASALGISDSGIIVGTGVYNGQTHAYEMIPLVPEPSTWVFLTAGLGWIGWMICRRAKADERVSAALRA